MTVVQHLDEFRYRLIVSLIAFVACTIVAYVFYRSLLGFLTHPLDQGGRVGGVQIKDLSLFVTGITAPFVLRVKISAFAGLLFSLPVVLFQVWRFITPGLEENEKRFAVPFVLTSLGLFALGTWFAFLILPTGIRFLLGFVEPGIQAPFITFQSYFSFISLMIVAFGLSFEFPLVLVFLGMVGIVTSARLRAWRKYAFFFAFLVGAVATPSQDPFSQVVLSVPLYILYEISILVIRFVLKR